MSAINQYLASGLIAACHGAIHVKFCTYIFCMNSSKLTLIGLCPSVNYAQKRTTK